MPNAMQRLATWQLFAICVLTWATTWHAITYQLAALAPEYGVALRFGLAGALVLAMSAAGGQHRPRARDHVLLALQGAFLYGVAYVGVYHAERYIASGLVAVGYSASPLITGLGARVAFGVRLGPAFVPGGLLGLAGVALIFWPEFSPAHRGEHVALGAALTIASVLLSAIGSVAASRNRLRAIPFWPALGWGMVYGALASALLGAARGAPLEWPMATAWWAAYAYLVLAGSILTFACFLTLQDRIGPGPTGTIGVMTPLIALLVSVAFEGFRIEPLTLAGAALAVLGNALMLRPARAEPGPAAA
jgi:drug/metabolite transporter (DMT)-like permease